jgi:hypothetical protein
LACFSWSVGTWSNPQVVSKRGSYSVVTSCWWLPGARKERKPTASVGLACLSLQQVLINTLLSFVRNQCTLKSSCISSTRSVRSHSLLKLLLVCVALIFQS